MAKAVRISLANKCQLMFGAAVVLILGSALTVGWIRMQTLVREGQEETARQLANAWIDSRIELPQSWASNEPIHKLNPGLIMNLYTKEEFQIDATHDPFLNDAIALFETRDDKDELFREVDDGGEAEHYLYARAIRKSDLSRLGGGSAAGFTPGIDSTALADPIEMVLTIRMPGDLAQKQLTLNRIYIVAAGLLAGLLAIGTFWFISTRIILSPVRVLRDTAEQIAEGDMNIRSDINTGDEFEQLSDVFNTMVERLKDQQEEMAKSNKSLDLKLGELAESNIALYEANKIKGEFLANVSHELRTPLNSIIGFAEVLQESLASSASSESPGAGAAKGDGDANSAPAGNSIADKQQRYASNIAQSSRLLLNLINDLLDLAKIEAGRIDVNVEPISMRDTAEGLLNLIRPLAEKRNITLTSRVEPNLPTVYTDPGKVHQILFNFLSNAIKFSPENDRVSLLVEANQRTPLGSGQAEPCIRISVSDNGHGIAIDDQDAVFEKFTQLDTSVTREHGGTGLGLTISRDLAHLLNGSIELTSDVGKGATFTLILPFNMTSTKSPLMPDLASAPRGMSNR